MKAKYNWYIPSSLLDQNLNRFHLLFLSLGYTFTSGLKYSLENEIGENTDIIFSYDGVVNGGHYHGIIAFTVHSFSYHQYENSIKLFKTIEEFILAHFGEDNEES